MAIQYSIEFAAQIARLEQGTRAGARHVKKMADEMEGAASFARNALLGLAGALGVGSFASAIKGAADAADAAAKMGDRFGIATEKLIGMQHAGDLAGASNEAMATALRSMAKSGIDAARGSEEAAKAYGMLGINAAEFVKLPMDQQLSTVIDKLGQVENVALRNALAQEVLGKSAGEMMGLVAEGSEAFRKAAEDAEAWGLAINRVDAAKIEMANDAITRAQSAAKGFFTTLALQVAPAIKAVADAFADSAAEAKGFRDEAARGSEVVITAIAYTMNVVQGLRFAYVGIKLAVAEFADLSVRAWITVIDTIRNSGMLKFLELMPGPVGTAAGAMINFGERASNALRDVQISTRNTADTIKAELDAIATEGLPAEKIIAKVRDIRARMEEEAVEIARRRQEMMTGSGLDIEQDKAAGKDGKAPKDTWRDQLAAKVERIREENMTELELLDEKLREKNLILQAAFEADLITEEQGLAMSADLLKKYEEQKTKIRDEEEKKRWGIANVYRKLDLQSASTFFGYMAGLMQTKSRALFEIGKAGAIGETVIQTYTAAQGAYAALSRIPIVGPALGIAAAAAATLSGMARVQAIRNTQFGGGSVATPVFSASPSTGVPTAPIGPNAAAADPISTRGTEQQRRQVNITFVGGEDRRYSYREVADEIMPLLNEAIGNGVEINVRAAYA